MVAVRADWLLATGMWVLLLLYARWLGWEQERLEREERFRARRKAAPAAERSDGRPAPDPDAHERPVADVRSLPHTPRGNR